MSETRRIYGGDAAGYDSIAKSRDSHPIGGHHTGAHGYKQLRDDGAAPAGKCCGCCSHLCGGITLLILGIILAVLGWTVVLGLVQGKISSGLEEQYCPLPNTTAWDEYVGKDKSKAAGEYEIFYFYNITNWEEFAFRGANPEVEEVGPFVYSMNASKVDATFDDKAKEITYLPQAPYVFEPEEVTFDLAGGGTESFKSLDPSTTTLYQVNVPFYSALSQIATNPYNTTDGAIIAAGCGGDETGYPFDNNIVWCVDEWIGFDYVPFGGLGFNDTMAGPGQGLVTNKTAEEWLGFTDKTAPTLDTLFAILHYVQGLPNTTDARFAFFYNQTTDNVADTRYNIRPWSYRCDRDDLSRAQTMSQWDGNRVLYSAAEQKTKDPHGMEVSFHEYFVGWEEEIDLAKDLYGNTMARPGLSAGDTFSRWFDNFVRGVPLVHDQSGGASTTLKGVDVFKFVFGDEPWNGTQAYRDAFHSPWAGLANATVTNQYTPAYLSPSRFLGYPEINQTWKIGNFPPANQSDDELYFHVEPVSGAIVDARVKIQTNILIPNWTFVNSSISYYNMSHSLLPVFTTLYRSQLTQSNADELKQLQSAQTIMTVIKVIASVVGGLMVLIGVYFIYAHYNRKGQGHTAIQEREDYSKQVY